MKSFEYANPETETEALEFLNEHGGRTAVLAGGTDLLRLLKADLAEPDRVVDVKNIPTLQGIRRVGEHVSIGAMTTLEDLAASPLLAAYSSLLDVVRATHSMQIQASGTLSGDLCHLPNCWYFRQGYGLLALANGESLPETGDNRYHAILGHRGPAKFVSASRFAPALCAWQARVRIIGPQPDQAEVVPLASFFVTPRTPTQGVTVLRPGQLLTHILLPAAESRVSATYEVLELNGLDWPLAAAAATLRMDGSLVREAHITMGHVAPVPWQAHEAAAALVGAPLTPETAQQAGDLAVAQAVPLSHNAYKVQLARTAVKRALLRATGQLEGGL